MQIIHFTDENVGSFDWELPKDMAARLEELPPEVRADLLKMVRHFMRANCNIILGALYSGAHAQDAITVLMERGAETAEMLSTLIKE